MNDPLFSRDETKCVLDGVDYVFAEWTLTGPLCSACAFRDTDSVCFHSRCTPGRRKDRRRGYWKESA